MKVSVLSNTRGGVFTFTRGLALGLASRGFALDLFFLGPSCNRVEGDGISVRYLSSRGRPDLMGFLRVLRDDADVLHINFASYGAIALLEKLVRRKPYVLTLHGIPQPSLQPTAKSKLAYAFEGMMIPLVARHSAATVAVSGYVAEELEKRYGVDAEVISHGYADRGGERIPRVEAKRRLGYSEADGVVLFVGNLNPYKDPLTLVRAVASLPEEVKLLMVGSGELREEVLSEAEKAGVAGRMRVLEGIPDEELSLCYAAADAFVLPSVNEAFGIVLLEAMAAGVPVVASDTGACPEVVGEAGLLFRHGDPRSLADRLAELLRDPAESSRLSRAGAERVRSLFDPAQKIDMYARLFERVTGQRTRP